MTSIDVIAIFFIMNYVTPVSIYGMLPANAEFVDGHDDVIYKNKRHKQILSWNASYMNDDVPVSYFYINELPDDTSRICSISKKQQLINGIFNEDFFKLSGKQCRHLREYKNFYDKRLKTVSLCNLDAVLDLIRRWEALHGHSRYRMIMHSSYDKRFFKRSLECIQSDVEVFYFMDHDKCVGYKVLERQPSIREDGILEFRSLLRKYDPTYSHICQYIDLVSYQKLFNEHDKPFVVNVGCSSGGVASYKKEKFPTYALEDVYFYKSKTHNV